MSFIDWIFGKKPLPKQPDIRFGHYTDAYKTKAQLDAWEQSRLAFEREDFVESYRQLLNYIRDEKENNLTWSEQDGALQFELRQGSQKVVGYANQEHFFAQVAVVKTKALKVGLLRRILDQNTKLTYSSYALNADNEIVIKFVSHSIDSSPYKIYYGLKEIATHADKQDDLLIHDFETTQAVDESLQIAIPDEEKELKYNYLVNEVNKAIQIIQNSKLNLQQQPKAVGYVLLDTIFRVEYMTCPEGFTMEAFEQAQRQYFFNDGKNQQQKNTALQKEIERIAQQPKDSIFKEMYRVKSTFGITQSVSQEVFFQYYDQESLQIEWFAKAGHEQIALAVCNNIVGFCLFNYTLSKPLREFLHLYFEVIEEDFFKNLGFNLTFNKNDSSVNKKELKRYIDQIILENEHVYYKIAIDTNLLDCSNKLTFADSYLRALRNIDFSKK